MEERLHSNKKSAKGKKPKHSFGAVAQIEENEKNVSQGAGTVGKILAQRRDELKLDLAHISAKLNIRKGLLTALETDDMKALPGTAYAVGFIRTYANFLGLDGEALSERYRTEQGLGAKISKADLSKYPVPTSEQKLPSAPVMLLSALGAIIVLVAWTLFSSGDEDVMNDIKPPPLAETSGAQSSGAQAMTGQTATAPDIDQTMPSQNILKSSNPDQQGQAVSQPFSTPDRAATTILSANEKLAPEPALASAETTSSDVTSSLPETSISANDATQAAVTQNTSVEANAAMTSEQEKQATTEQDPTNQSLAEEESKQIEPNIKEEKADKASSAGQSRITLKARDLSWVQIVDQNGRVIFKRVLRPGESYKVPNIKGATLTTGNAGGLDIFVDGKSTRALGEKGVVARGIALDADRLQKRRAYTSPNPWRD